MSIQTILVGIAEKNRDSDKYRLENSFSISKKKTEKKLPFLLVCNKKNIIFVP